MEGMPCPKPSFIRGITTLEFEQKLKSPGFLKHKIEIKAGKVNQIVQIVPPTVPLPLQVRNVEAARRPLSPPQPFLRLLRTQPFQPDRCLLPPGPSTLGALWGPRVLTVTAWLYLKEMQ